MKLIPMSRTFLLFSFLLMGSAAMAQIPQLISYQGFLTDNNRAIADGDYSITVKIFDASTAGNELWTETLTVSTINGLFSTSLGAVTPFNLPFDQAYFLSTTFDGTELLPRTAMTASPYAFNSIQAGNPYALDNADGSAQEVVFVDADSKIGLGTNTPNTNVHIKSPIGVKNELFIEPGNWNIGGDEAQISLGDFNHRITARFGEGMNFFDVNQFRFIASDVTIERRLGIGADPGLNELLYVDGNIRVKEDNSIFGLDGLWGFNDLRFFGDQNGIESGPDMIITADGKVGIGSDPDWRFQAQGTTSEFRVYGDDDDNVNGTNLVAGFFAKNTLGAVARFASEQSPAFVDIGTNVNGAFVIEHDDQEAFILSTDGNVMVGPTTNGLTSVSKFQVNGTDGRAALLQDSELKLLGPSTIHFSILNDQGGTLRIQDASSLAQPGTPGFNLMSIQSNGNVTIPGAFFAVSITETSDRRYKKNFTAIDQPLNKVLQLDGLYYNWRVDEFPTKKFTTEQQMGFIAQDIEKLFPEMVHTDEAGYKSVNYGKLTPVLVEAIKEQQGQIDQLKAEKVAFQAELADLKANVMARLEALEQQKDNSKNSASRTSERK